jgi:hypothetical protein
MLLGQMEPLEHRTAELVALGPSFFSHGWQIGWERDGVRALTLRVHGEQDARSLEQARAILGHRYTRSIRDLSLDISTSSPVDGLLAVVGEARPPALERLFVSSPSSLTLDLVRSLFAKPGRLTTFSRVACFGAGPFQSVRLLDLRDQQVQWAPSETEVSWPDLEVLILRPRGGREHGRRWATQVLSSARAMPKLREVRAVESRGDDLLEVVLASPLLPQLRRLDFTDNLTNRGAELLYTNAERLAGVEELWIAYSGRWRGEVERMLAARNPMPEPPPVGELEIDGRWRSRLSQRFRGRARFEIPKGHPDL